MSEQSQRVWEPGDSRMLPPVSEEAYPPGSKSLPMMPATLEEITERVCKAAEDTTASIRRFVQALEESEKGMSSTREEAQS